MTLKHIPLDELTELHLKGLIDNGVPETRDLEFKREIYGRNDDAKKEFLKDVSALANTAGGDLIIGIAESDGVADSLVGITSAPADEEIRRLESMLQDGLEPRLIGTRMRSVSLAEGSYALVIRVLASWNAPHRIVFKRTNRFYARNGAGAYELGVEQLRAAFLGTSEVERHLTEFRLERLARFKGGVGPKLAGPGQFVLHIVPLQHPSSSIDLDVATEAGGGQTKPMGAGSWGRVSNFDGVLIPSGEKDDAGRYWSIVQLFRSGMLESARGRIIFNVPQSARPFLAHAEIVKDLIEAIPRYCRALSRSGSMPPFGLMASLLDIGGSQMLQQWPSHLMYPPLDRDDLLFDPILIKDVAFNDGWQTVLKPLLDVLWNAYGRSRCSDLFDSNGNWKGYPAGW